MSKSTGITRKVDELGRIVLPMEMRNKLELSSKTLMEVYTNGPLIILKKFEPNCTFCGSSKKLMEYKNKLVCEKCMKKIIKK
jgi:transcriptional pleiotropic regulator of transition state genes